MPLGYATMGTWFMGSGVSLFGGKNLSGKVATFFLSLLGDFIPLLNIILPGLTVWTIRMIYYARSEDKEKAKKGKTGYDGEKNYSRMRVPQRHYVPTKTY